MMRLPKSDLFLLPSGASIAKPLIAAGRPPSRRADAVRGQGPETPRTSTKPRALPAADSSAPASGVKVEANPDGHRPAGTLLRFELARALPALWSKAQRDFADGRADREKEKLRELILWLLSKKCSDVRQRQTVNFQHDGRRTSGRVDVVAYSPAGPALAIEMDWAYARKSLEKLQAGQLQGWEVMWVCGAKMDKAAARAMRVRANAELGPTFRWLHMFHLEHGWL